MFSTFNFWFIVLPLTLLIAAILAIISIAEDRTGARKRVSDRVWKCGMAAYCVIVWVALSKLFIAESLLGMIEALGDYADNMDAAASRAKSTFWILTAIWAIALYIGAFCLRSWYADRVDDAVARGYSRADRKRRRRGKHKQRIARRELAARRKAAENGRLYVVDFGKDGTSMKTVVKQEKATKQEAATQQKTPTPDTRRAKSRTEQLVDEAIKGYRIEKWNDLKIVYSNSDGNKYYIAEYLPEGVNEFFVAINLKKEDADIFLTELKKAIKK